MDELQIMPEPSGKEPEYAQRKAVEIREQQLLACQDAKSIGIRVLQKVLQYASDVVEGKETVEVYDQKGNAHVVDGRKYMLENSNNLKSLIGSVQAIEGNDAQDKNVMHVAILGRTSQRPLMVTDAEILKIEDVE